MQPLTSNSFFLMENTLKNLWTRQTAILDNISNAETPGYKAKYVTFEDTLRDRLKGAQGGALSKAAIRRTVGGVQAEIHQGDESTRMDENSVNVTEQNVELTRTAFEMQYLMQSISTDIATLSTAIRGQ